MEKPVTPPPLEIECSPRTFQRIQSDPEYLQEVVAQHLTHASTIDEDFVPNSSSATEDFVPIEELEEETYDGPSKQVWLEAATKLLLVLIKQMAPKVGKSMKLKTKKKMWQAIKDRLAEKRYGFSVTQIEAKYRGLERQYKRTKVHNGQTGRNRMTYPFENEMNSIMEKKIGVFPEYILGSSCSQK